VIGCGTSFRGFQVLVREARFNGFEQCRQCLRERDEGLLQVGGYHSPITVTALASLILIRIALYQMPVASALGSFSVLA
jgi:hypothetical protein